MPVCGRARGDGRSTCRLPTVDLVVGRPTGASSAAAQRTHKTHGAGGLGIEHAAFRFRSAVCLFVRVLAPLGCAAADLGALPLGVVVCCCGGLLILLVSNHPCISPALALH